MQCQPRPAFLSVQSAYRAARTSPCPPGIDKLPHDSGCIPTPLHLDLSRLAARRMSSTELCSRRPFGLGIQPACAAVPTYHRKSRLGVVVVDSGGRRLPGLSSAIESRVSPLAAGPSPNRSQAGSIWNA